MYLDPSSSVTITIDSVIDGNGCMGTGFETIELTVNPLPVAPQKPQGEINIDTYVSTTFDYTIEDLPNCDSYEWELIPAEAGNMAAPRTQTCTIEWNGAYTGSATLKARGVNECGEGAYSQELMVDIGSSFGISELEDDFKARIYPNPSDGSFKVDLQASSLETVTLRVINSYGNVMYNEQNVNISNQSSIDVNLSDFAEGIYFLIIEGEGMRSYKKIVIR
jgi:hypothetical protein